MQHDTTTADKASGRAADDIIDGELADQLDYLIDRMEAVRWVDVPGVSAATAAAFNRELIESRKEMLNQHRLVTDGGQQRRVEDDEMELPAAMADVRMTPEEANIHANAIAENTVKVVVNTRNASSLLILLDHDDVDSVIDELRQAQSESKEF